MVARWPTEINMFYLTMVVVHSHGHIPSGYDSHSHGKSPFLIGKLSIHGPFSMAMFNNQRVKCVDPSVYVWLVLEGNIYSYCIQELTGNWSRRLKVWISTSATHFVEHIFPIDRWAPQKMMDTNFSNIILGIQLGVPKILQYRV